MPRRSGTAVNAVLHFKRLNRLTFFGGAVRITVYDDSVDSRRTMVGWFDMDRAEHFRPDSLRRHSFDDGARPDGQSLYRTTQVRWVLREDCAGSADSVYRFLSPTQARRWLNHQDLGDVAARYFSRRPASSTPRKVGRPEVGGPVTVRLGDELLTQVDNYAGERNVSRADAIRDLIKNALSEVHSLDELGSAP